MSFVFVDPQIVAAAAAELTGIGSTLSAANAAAAGSTTSLLAAAADDVSVQLAALFSGSGQEYQRLSAQIGSGYRQFVQTVSAGANEYVAAEVHAAQAVRSAASVETALQLALSGDLSGIAAELNAALSGLGVQLNAAVSGNVSGEVGGLSAVVRAGGQLAANVNAGINAGLSGLSGSFGGGCSNLGANLSGLAQTGASLTSSLNAGFNSGLTALAQTGASLASSLNAGLPALAGGFSGGLNGGLSNLGAQLNSALSGSFSGGLPDLTALAQTGQSLVAGLDTGLNAAINAVPGLAGNVSVDLPGLVANFDGDISGMSALINAAVTGSFNGDFSGLRELHAVVSAAPSAVLGQLGGAQVDVLTGVVNAELAFNQNLVASEVALQQAVFGTDTALNGAVNAGFNAANLLVGTGEQFVNVLLGAPTPESFTGSLLIGGSLEGGVPNGGLVGVVEQSLLLNAALGGPDLSPLQQMIAAQAGINADMVAGQLAFNQALLANEVGLQTTVFGSNSALNGALNNFFNMVNFAVGTGQQSINVVLGAPMPVNFTDSLLLEGSADVFGGLQTGGLLGAVEQKFLFDAALLTNWDLPIQLLFNGGPTGGGVEVGGEVSGVEGGGL